MKKNKFKCLIVILALCIANSPLSVFANTSNSAGGDNNSDIIGKPPINGNTELQGEIGEWDPTLDDKLDFDDGTDIEGTLPTRGKYFTISVTVPVDMKFMVLPSSTLAFGSFYSPKYTIKNNGSKTIVAKVQSFERDTTIKPGSDETPLLIEKVVRGDGNTQMELNLCPLDNTIFNDIEKKIDLTSIGSLSDDDKTLAKLGANESKKIKFHSDNWELPQYESKKERASSSYTAGFEFSIANP